MSLPTPIIVTTILSLTILILFVLWIIQRRWEIKTLDCQCQSESQEALIAEVRELVNESVNEKLQLREKLEEIELLLNEEEDE